MRAVLGVARVIVTSAVLATAIVVAAQQAPAVRPLVDKMHRRLQPEEATDFSKGNTIVIAGDPSKSGMCVIRRLSKPGETSAPHYHDRDRYVTVIKGTWYTGEGDAKDPKKMVPIKTGGFMLHPAGLHHYDGSNDGNEVIVQIIGMGPVKTTDVDPQGRAVQTR
jgi:quercetin dioxygenase-like cupin family protein